MIADFGGFPIRRKNPALRAARGLSELVVVDDLNLETQLDRNVLSRL
jgi:hypothetical protein